MTTIPKFMMLPRPRCSFSEAEVAWLDGEPGAEFDAVTSRTADGYYLDHRGDWMQVIIVGEPAHTVEEIASHLHGFDVHSSFVMEKQSDCPPELVSRKFFSILLVANDDRQDWTRHEHVARKKLGLSNA